MYRPRRGEEVGTYAGMRADTDTGLDLELGGGILQDEPHQAGQGKLQVVGERYTVRFAGMEPNYAFCSLNFNILFFGS